MHWLRRGVADGARNLGAMKNEFGLQPLRSRPDFQMLMLDVAFPTDPFAQWTNCSVAGSIRAGSAMTHGRRAAPYTAVRNTRSASRATSSTT